MKNKMLLMLVALVMLFSMTMAVPGRAENTRIYFTGSEQCNPDTFVFARIWESGPNLHISQIMQTCCDIADIPQLTGTDYLFDARVNLVGKGQIYNLSGKLRMESSEGGIWVGSWVLPANTSTIQVIAHGEGLYEGQQLHWFLVDSGPFNGYIEITGN
jgi:hypothetical protein